jgi:hypothetical protein
MLSNALLAHIALRSENYQFGTGNTSKSLKCNKEGNSLLYTESEKVIDCISIIIYSRLEDYEFNESLDGEVA